ncbi:MAG: site-specific integrase [Flavobacteriales bacterium]|nr:site-specific integrase [Flavobacteriales bacterium]
MAGASINLHPKAKSQGFSARFVCLTGKTVKGEMHPVRLQLIHNLKVKRFSTGEACTLNEWDADAGRMKPRAKSAAAVNRVLNAMEAQVVSIVDALVVHGTLSLNAFEARYRNPKASADVLAYMEGLALKFTKEGRIGYAGTFRTASAALGRLTTGKPIRFADLTAAKLEELEAMLKEEGGTGGGIAAYMRTIRVAINTAIKEGHMAADQYPFETATHAGYSMKRLKSAATPRALDAADMDKLKRFPFDKAPHLAESVRYFLFSYYADGMNFQDIARLKPENLVGGRIFYARKKTGRPINIPLDEVLSGILAAFEHDGPYLFPILGAKHVTDQQQWDRIRKCLKKVNADLKEAAEVVGIRTNLTTYVARHTSFTTLYRNGVALEHISELARHSSPAVTQLYLRELGCDVLDEARKKLR